MRYGTKIGLALVSLLTTAALTGSPASAQQKPNKIGRAHV